MKLHQLVSLGLIFGLTLVLGCGTADYDTRAQRRLSELKLGGAATPDAAFDEFKRAITAKDWRRAFKLYSTGGGNGAVNRLATALAAAKDKNPDFAQVLKAQGVEVKESTKEIPADKAGGEATKITAIGTGEIKDKPAFYEAALLAIEKYAGQGSPPTDQFREFEMSRLVPAAQWKGAQLAEDRAVGTAAVESGDRPANLRLQFIKEQGRWFIDQTPGVGAAQPPPPIDSDVPEDENP